MKQNNSVEQTSNQFLTETEKEIFGILEISKWISGDSQNDENVDLLECLFQRFEEVLDPNVIDIAINRTRFFMCDLDEFYYADGTCPAKPDWSPLLDRLLDSLSSAVFEKSSGIKAEILCLVRSMDIRYFYGEFDDTDLESLRKLVAVFRENRICEPELIEFINSNILKPWSDYLACQPESKVGNVTLKEWESLSLELKSFSEFS